MAFSNFPPYHLLPRPTRFGRQAKQATQASWNAMAISPLGEKQIIARGARPLIVAPSDIIFLTGFAFVRLCSQAVGPSVFSSGARWLPLHARIWTRTSPACSHLDNDFPCVLAKGGRPPAHARKRRTTSSACSEEPGCLAGHRAWHPDEAGSVARAVRGAATHTKGCPRQARGTVAILAQERAQGTRRGWPRGKRAPPKILKDP